MLKLTIIVSLLSIFPHTFTVKIAVTDNGIAALIQSPLPISAVITHEVVADRVYGSK